MTPSLQFARALIRGARLYHRLGVSLVSAGWSAILSFILPVRRRVAPEVARARMLACESCPLFEPTLRTCGDGVSVAEYRDERLGPVGCQCWLPLKTILPDAECWLVDIGRPSRWPDANRTRPEHPDAAPTP